MELNDVVETVTVDAQKKFYSLATVVCAAVAGSAVTAAAFTVNEVVKKRRAKKELSDTSSSK